MFAPTTMPVAKRTISCKFLFKLGVIHHSLLFWRKYLKFCRALVIPFHNMESPYIACYFGGAYVKFCGTLVISCGVTIACYFGRNNVKFCRGLVISCHNMESPQLVILVELI